MSKHPRALAVGATIVAGLAAAPAPYAQDYLSMPESSKMGQGMMGPGGMMGMLGMSGGMGGMMEQCSTMMQGMDGQRPNDQWRTPQPEQRGQGQE